MGGQPGRYEPGDVSPLWGRTFVAVEVNESGIVPPPLVEGTEIVLTFTPPMDLRAYAGCNSLRCRVEIEDARLLVDDRVSSTKKGCSDEMSAQDRWLAAFLVDDPAYTFEEDTLTLTRGSTEIVLVTRQSG